MQMTGVNLQLYIFFFCVQLTVFSVFKDNNEFICLELLHVSFGGINFCGYDLYFMGPVCSPS